MCAERPFVDRPTADVPAATRLAERVATDAGLAPPVLLKVGMNAIYRAGDVVLRVSHLNGPAASAYALADVLAAAGSRGRATGGGTGSSSPMTSQRWW